MRTLFTTLGACLLLGCSSTDGSSSAVTAGPAAVEPMAHALPKSVLDMDGGSHAVANRSGTRPLVLVFWQVWCKSCAQEAPALALAAKQFQGRVEFLGVVPGPDDLVDDDKVRATAASWGMPYPSVRDRDLALTKGLEVEGTPTIVVLGANAQVLYRGHQPPSDWNQILR